MGLKIENGFKIMIPKKIITIWLSENETPEIVEKCNKSKNLFCKKNGYEHIYITLDNVYRGSEYVNKCIEIKEWVRAVDYLRLHYLNELGGIYLDADAEIIGNFDDILYFRMFVFTEESGYINNGYIGSEANHPFLKYLLNTMEHSFRFHQNLFWPGMQFFSESYYISDRGGLGMYIYPETVRKNLITHHEMKSWVT